MKPITLEACLALGAIAVGLGGSGCTKQSSNTFRLNQALENFAAAEEVNTKVDLLWVIDNSASMDVSQQKLRQGFTGFARKYLRPNWDARIAVITSDTFMAHPAFATYLRTTVPGTQGYQSPWIQTRLDSWVNPEYNRSLLHVQSGEFKQGFTYNDQVPAWGRDYAKLLPGMHDGPIAALCTELHSYFFFGESQCKIRDLQSSGTGPEGCLNPGPGQTSTTQCVNTVQNDTIHSGKAILSTRAPGGVDPEAWISQLVRDFMVNASVGSSGVGSERGMLSLLQLLDDNEAKGSSTAFFRPGSQRVIVFLSDEDDQSMLIPASPSADFTPYTGNLSSCPSKTVDGYTYKLSSCADPDKLMPVTGVKQRLDEFFATLDSRGGAASSGYVVIPVVATTGATVKALQAARAASDAASGNSGNVAVDRGDRYLELASLVGNGSRALDIGAEDYAPVLDTIGRAIVQRKSVFTLTRAPTGEEDMIVTIQHADGSIEAISPELYTVTGAELEFNDMDFVLSLSATDRIHVNYQPSTVY